MDPSSTLFVAELPENIDETALTAIFGNYEGFQALRLRKDKNSNTVAFLEFSSVSEAVRAKEQATDTKLGDDDKTIAIQYAHPKNRNRNNGSYNRGSSNNYQTSPTDQQRELSQQQPNPSFSLMTGGPFSNPQQIVYDQKAPGPRKQPYAQDYPGFYAVGHPATVAYSGVVPPLDHEASSTLYVEGLPLDATDREVAHIFRQWPGFQSLRILQKEGKQFSTPRVYNLCFVEFDNKHQATLAMNHIQGYRFDKNDNRGLILSYSKSERKERRNKTAPQTALAI